MARVEAVIGADGKNAACNIDDSKVNPMPDTARIERVVKRALVDLEITYYDVQAFIEATRLEWCAELMDREGKGRDAQVCIPAAPGMTDDMATAQFKRKIGALG